MWLAIPLDQVASCPVRLVPLFSASTDLQIDVTSVQEAGVRFFPFDGHGQLSGE